MPIPGRKIRIQLDPTDADSTVDLSLVEELTTKEGSGPDFKRRIVKFNNYPDNESDRSRDVAIRTIGHKQRLPEDAPDDTADPPNPKLDVEVILGATFEEGSGLYYKKRIYTLNWDKKTNLRTTHIKRIYKRDPVTYEKDPDVWIDVRRKDQYITQQGSGPEFMRYLTTVGWGDEEDDNEFDKNDLVAQVIDKTKPVRLDFLQDIENINAGAPLLIITLKIILNNVFPVLHSGTQMFNTILVTPEVPAVLEQIGPPAVPAKPKINEHRIEFATLEDDFWRNEWTYDAPATTPVDPFTKDMFKHSVLWNLAPGRVISGGATDTEGAWNTFFINLAKFRQGNRPKAVFKIELNGAGIADPRKHIFRGDYQTTNLIDLISGPPGTVTPGFFEFVADDFTPIATQLAWARDQMTALIASNNDIHEGTLFFEQIGDVIDEGKAGTDDVLPDPTPPHYEWELSVRLYGSGKHFPFKTSGEPDFTKQDWSAAAIPPAPPVSRVTDEEIRSFSGDGNIPAKLATITVNFFDPSDPNVPPPDVLVVNVTNV